MSGLLFGTAGTPLSAKGKGSTGGIERIRELGLDCMELEFVRGVRMKEETAAKVKEAAQKYDVALSVHAPYYINLNSREPEKITASIERIYQSARIGNLCGADSIIFHPAYYHKDNSETVLKRVIKSLEELTQRLKDENIPVFLRPETTGKPTQFGDLRETVEMARTVDNVLPCIDFSHLHARSTGQYNTYEEFCDILSHIEDKLGRFGLENLHCHISGIEYGPKGEKNHLILEESDLNYKQLLKALRDFNVSGRVICESPNLEEDALLMQKFF